MPLDGASVLLTGASSGIGAELAPMLAEQGADVGIVARRADRLEAVLERCRAAQPGCRSWVADLSDLGEAERIALEADDAFGGIDVLINNAAIPKRRRAVDLDPDEIETVMRVNYLSPVRMTLALLPRMVDRGRGMVVNVSSLAGRLGVPAEAAYSASKFALCGFSESLAIDLWGTPIEVRLVLPGAIDTEIWDQPDNDPPLYEGPKEPATDVATGIVAAIEGDRFEHYLPDMKAIVEYKTGDVDDYLRGAAGLGPA